VNAQKANDTKGKVRELQRKLYIAAKSNGRRKFHALYDKVYDMPTLAEAWKRVKANGGSSGIDGMSIQDTEGYGVEKILHEIQNMLIDGNYHPQPVKRVNIPKPDGKKRPLGIPTIKDRIVQMATKIIIEPLFEAHFKDTSWGFRPKRSAHQALEQVREACDNNGWWVVDADIRGFFDNINHEKLMKLVEVRINDRRVLKLIRKWLEAGVTENGEYRESSIGSPQGGVISPLLANIYLNYFDTLWERDGKQLGKLVRYADDLVIICRTRKSAEHALKLVKEILERLELELHPEKTKLVHMWGGKEGFDFLGMHHRFMQVDNRRKIKLLKVHQYPGKKAMRKMRETIKTILSKRKLLKESVAEIVDRLNPKLRGWKNYYGLRLAVKWLAKIDWYVQETLTRWWNKKRQNANRRKDLGNMRVISGKYGLVTLTT